METSWETTVEPSRWRRLTRRLTTSVGAFGMTGALLFGACGPTAPQCAPAAPAPAASAVQQVVDITNARRAENGLGALRTNAALGRAAQAHSKDQAATNTMTHRGSDGSNAGTRIDRTGYRWNTYGENVASAYRDARSVMSGWMNSSGHRANILNGNVTEIGIGLAHAADGTPYWTMVLARSR